ncbi:MAG: VOC family protein [Myxococcota bacterium]
MSVQSITPYLLLNGRTRDAIALYEQALGATTHSVATFGDTDGSCPSALEQRVMHAELRVNGAVLLMSDGPADSPVPDHNMVNIAIAFDDPAELRRAFDALAVGGRVFEKVFPPPWGGLFGMVVDRFGMQWMCTCERAD